MSGRGGALAIALALGATLMLAASALVALVGRTEGGEWALFLLAFAAVLPASLVAAWRLAAGGHATRTRAAAGLVAAAALVGFARLLHALEAPGDAGAAAVLGAALVAAAAIVAPLAGVAIAGLRPPRGRPRSAVAVPAVAAALLVLLVLAFAPRGLLDPLDVALSLLAAAAAVSLYARLRPPSLPRRLAVAVDVLAPVLAILLVVDLVGYAGDGPALSSGAGLTERMVVPSAQIHLDTYLGPVNDVLHGRPLLVETASQYGVLAIYALARWAELTELGYGPLGFLVSLVTALQFAMAYGISRLGGAGPLLAAGATLLAVVVTVLAGFGSPTFFPSTGGLRFGLAFLLVLVALVAARRAPGANPLALPALVVLALASVWSFETFVYALAGFAAIALVDAAIRGLGLREALRRCGFHAVRAAAAVGVAHAVFALATRALGGEWPDWGWYVEYVRAFSRTGHWTAPGSAWSPVWPIGAVYFVVLAVAATVLASSREVATRERLPLIALCGTAAVGVAFLPYFVGRSIDVLLAFVALPAFTVAAVGLAWLLRDPLPSRGTNIAAVGFCSWLAMLLLALAAPLASDRLPRTALAQLAPGGRSPGESLERLWDSPPMDPRAPAGARLVRAHLPRSERALVIAEPDLAQEVLLRTGRANALPIAFPWQDDLLARSLEDVGQAAARLRPGTLMLFQPDAERRLSKRPAVGVIGVIGGNRLSLVQLHALRTIRARFELAPVARGPEGLEIVRLVPKGRD